MVIQWNKELNQVLVAPGAQPASIHPTRTLAITQLAVDPLDAGWILIHWPPERSEALRVDVDHNA